MEGLLGRKVTCHEHLRTKLRVHGFSKCPGLVKAAIVGRGRALLRAKNGGHCHSLEGEWTQATVRQDILQAGASGVSWSQGALTATRHFS